MIRFITRSILLFVIFITTGLIAWKCSQADGYCLPSARFNLDYIKHKADEYNNQVVLPLVNNIHEGYEYMGRTNLKTAYKTAVYDGSSLRIVRVMDWIYHGYIQPSLATVQHKISDRVSDWKNQLIDYVNNPQYDVSFDDENVDIKQDDDLHSGRVEDNIKKTAKRILDYIDQVNQESTRSGMKREDARRKAQEIIREITHPNTVQDQSVETKDEEAQSSEEEISKVAFEIREILKVSQDQRDELEAHLSLIQSNLSPTLLNQHDPKLLASALKSEIDQMRQESEDQVRARTNQALNRLYPLLTDIVMSRVKSDIHSAQRSALRNLRDIYPRIYELHEAIDNLFNL
jgi:hypothetical protein